MKIYTKTGDKGTTGLMSGKRVPKSNPRLEAYGTLDELNSALGIALADLNLRLQDFNEKHKSLNDLQKSLVRIQNEIFCLGSLLACDDEKRRTQLPQISNDHIEVLEKEIDLWTQELKPLRNFILPGGDILAAYLQLARTICRRAERCTTEFYQIDNLSDGVEPSQLIESTGSILILTYLNRLSDHLFVAARLVNDYYQVREPIWTGDFSAKP